MRSDAGGSQERSDLSAELQNEFATLKRRRFIWICLIFSAVGSILMTVHIWALGKEAWHTVIVAIPCQVAFIGSILVVRITGSVEKGAWVAVVSLCVGVFSLALEQGGLLSHAAPILLVGPAMAAFFINVRATLGVSIVCAGFLIALYFLRSHGMIDERLLLTGDLRALVTAFVLVTILLCIGLINALFLETNERIQQKLIDVSHEAQAANAAKDRFVATMSHEIRTPLNGVTGMSELLLQTDLTDQQRRWALMVGYSARSLSTILDDVLDVSRLGSGTFEIVIAPFRMETLCTTSLGMVEPLARDKGLALTCELDPGVAPGYVGDQARIRQILLNLIGNALKFTDRGEVALKVATDDQGVAFSVRDTGPGIAAKDHEAIFERFHQIDQNNHRQYGGTGLGLAISRELAYLMGGDITLESELGAGSTFTLRIPLRIDLSHTDAPAA